MGMRLFYCSTFAGNKELWPDIISWMIDGMTRLEKAIRPSLQELAVELKKSGLITEGGDE